MKILVIEASALHLGFLGCYGNDWVATPSLDQLAATGIVFDQHFADSPEPYGRLPTSQRSVATAVYRFPASTPLDVPVVPSSQVGYKRVKPLKGFAASVIEALESRDDGEPAILWIDGPNLTPPWRLSREMLAAYLDDDEQTPAAVLANPVQQVAPVADGELEILQAAYAAVLTFFDEQLGQVLDHLRPQDQHVVCITASCGVALGEHGMVGPCRAWLHDETVHIPLIVRLPGGEHGGTRVAALTQPIDLLPTLLVQLGGPVPTAHGQSLWPLIVDEAPAIRPYAVSGLRIGDSEEWLLRTPELACLLPIAVPNGDQLRQTQLYIKPEDRWEVNDTAPRREEYTETLAKSLRQMVAMTSQPGPIEYPPLPEES